MMKLLNRFLKWKPVTGGSAERVITFGYFTALLVSVIAIYMTANHVAQWLLFNADSLWTENYLQDWLVKGVDMKTWMTPGAPNFFPEMLIYGLFSFATSSIYWGFVGSGFVKIFFYIFIFYALSSLLTDILRVYKLWFSLFCTSTMLLVSILVGSQFSFTRMPDFWQLFVPVGHGGVIANAMIAIVIMFQWFRGSSRSRLWFFLLFVLSIIASLSDQLYVVWFIVPALGAAVVLLSLGRISWRSAAGLAGVLLISEIIGRRIFLGLVPLQPVSYHFSFKEGWKSTFQFYSVLFAEGWYHPIVLFSYICLVSVTLRVFFQEWRVRKRQTFEYTFDSKRTAKLFLLSYAVLVWPVSFFAMASINRPETQYFTGGDLLALSFWVFLLIMSYWGKQLWVRGWFHIVLLSMLLGYVTLLASSPPASLSTMLIPANPYSGMVACLDSHANDLGDGAGLADYWQVRPINLLSKKGLCVDQVLGGDLKIFQWASNQDMFSNRKHTFVITNTPTNLPKILDSDIIRINGQPDARFICNGFPILVYYKGLQVIIPLAERFRNFLKGRVDSVIIREQSDRPTLVGKWKDRVLYSTGNAGCLQFGPYVTLPSGSYRVEWKGEVVEAGPEAIGTVDVAINLGAKILASKPVTILTKAKLPRGQLAMMEFSIDRKVEAGEFRFFVNEKVMVRVDEVIIIRVR